MFHLESEQDMRDACSGQESMNIPQESCNGIFQFVHVVMLVDIDKPDYRHFSGQNPFFLSIFFPKSLTLPFWISTTYK